MLDAVDELCLREATIFLLPRADVYSPPQGYSDSSRVEFPEAPELFLYFIPGVFY
jgi:hypothetical protein